MNKNNNQCTTANAYTVNATLAARNFRNMKRMNGPKGKTFVAK